MVNYQQLKNIFFEKVYPGKSHYSLYRSIFFWMFDAAKFIQEKSDAQVLNIYSTHDKSSEREDVYKKYFFPDAFYQELNFSQDAFVDENNKSYPNHQIPFLDNQFEMVLTTKVILEHVSNPPKFLSECYRILKSGGQAFFIAPLVRRQHQVPFDFFRFTQFGLEHMLKRAGFKIKYIKPTNGAITTAAFMSTFFVSGLSLPWFIKKIFFVFLKFIIDPLANWLDYYDKDKNIPIYFVIRVEK